MKAAAAARDEMAALALLKADMGGFQRLYSFLSQIFDYGNTAVEKRFMFYRRLLPLLEFGRERDGIGLSQVKLTHHNLKSEGKRDLGTNDPPKLSGVAELGSGSVQEKEKALLAEIIARVNELFEGDLTDDDQLVYVNNVIKGKLLESRELVLQASNNTKAQFANSPTLTTEIMNAVMDPGGPRDDEPASARLAVRARRAEGSPARAGATLRGAVRPRQRARVARFLTADCRSASLLTLAVARAPAEMPRGLAYGSGTIA
jgi:hypothetical protein